LAELGFACSSRERASQGPEAADAILLVSRLADRGGAGLDEEFVDHDASPPVFAVPAVRPDAATEAVLRQTGVAGVFTWPGDLGALENSLVRLLHDRCDASPADVALEERVRADVKRRLASVESKRIRIRAREGKVVELDVQDRRPDPWSH
jgi:hypothetical protein